MVEYNEAVERLEPYWELPETPKSKRVAYRKANREIDAILQKWYGYKPVTGARATGGRAVSPPSPESLERARKALQ